MFNIQGEVIGVVSNILTQSVCFQGFGFASSSNITKELLFEKKIIWNGTDLYPLTEKLARIFNLPQEDSLLVQRVVKVSPFGILGIQDGEKVKKSPFFYIIIHIVPILLFWYQLN